MCGIIGAVSKEKPIDISWFISGRDSMTHRGPNDSGMWSSKNGKIVFGHRRLSIIDLSSKGHQPMQNETETLVIIFNGEIYNYLEIKETLIAKGHSFESSTDTEVLLKAYQEWGKGCLNKLNGMFVFSIYDKKRKKIFIARDRAGEKPLFYYHHGNTFYFSSELKALMLNNELPKKINKVAFECFLYMGFIPGDLCILKNYNKLKPGHYLEYNLNNAKIKINRYWTLPQSSILNINNTDIQHLQNRLEMLLDDAVKKQLVSDVPLGVLLSGGLDSSLITALATRYKDDIKTFTVSFPGHGSYDESKHAKMIANYFKTDHIELAAEPPSIEDIKYIIKQFDEPIIDSSMIPTYLVTKAVSQHCTVALGGDGGDELFGGYNHYDRLLSMEKRLRLVPDYIKKRVGRLSESLPLGFKGRNWLVSISSNYSTGLPLIAQYFDSNSRKKLVKTGMNNPEKIFQSLINNNHTLLDRATRTDFSTYLPEDILVKVDRVSMLNSIELRAPFLDYRIIDFAFSQIPSELKATSRNKKILLKRLAIKLLPLNFQINRKQGFSIPINSWLKKGAFKDLIWETLLDSSSIFNKKYVHKLLLDQEKGLQNGERLFGLLQFDLWKKEYNAYF
jgi:asparagine synthase (glutamine-hydrolysing)